MLESLSISTLEQVLRFNSIKKSLISMNQYRGEAVVLNFYVGNFMISRNFIVNGSSVDFTFKRFEYYLNLFSL